MLSFGTQPAGEYNDFEELVDGVWIRNVESNYITGKTAWNWKRWFKCSAKRTAIGFYGVLIGCSFSGPLFLKCVGVGSLIFAASSMAKCAIDQIWD